MKPTFLYLNIYAACLPVLPFCVTSGFVGCANSVTVGGSGHDLVMMWRAPWEARSIGNTCFVLLCLCSCVSCVVSVVCFGDIPLARVSFGLN